MTENKIKNLMERTLEPSERAKGTAGVLAEELNISIDDAIRTVCIYDYFFDRYERRDYAVYPGLYCYDRIKDVLPRETFKIRSGGNLLEAYYYSAKVPRGLAVLVHGFHSGADDYLPLAEAIVNRGYSVLSYDATGTYSSEGDSVIGMCQALCDLDSVLNYVNDKKPFSDMPKTVVGHSWGGYAAASVLSLHSEVKAAVCIAPMNNGATIMLEKSEDYIGAAAAGAKPIFEAYQKLLFGDYVKYNGVLGINSTSVPVLIAQGVDDTNITPDKYSITAHLDRIVNPNLSVYWGKESQGSHSGIWHSDASVKYRSALNEDIKRREIELGRKLTKAELADIYSTVEHRLYSEVNTELVDLIIGTFDKGIQL